MKKKQSKLDRAVDIIYKIVLEAFEELPKHKKKIALRSLRQLANNASRRRSSMAEPRFGKSET